jgi:hypothetical protein
MESERGKLGQWRNRKGREQDREWRSARPRRRQAAGAMDASGKVRDPGEPHPRKLHASRPLMQAAPYTAEQRAQLRRNGRTHARARSLRRSNQRAVAPLHVRPHVTHGVCAAPPEKARPLRATAATTAII